MKLISAVSIDGAIGHDDKLLWHISEDLKRYKEKTMHNIVIVGLNTFMGMPVAAFKGRTAIIICGDQIDISKIESKQFAILVKTPEDAIKKANQIKKENQEIYVIGGQQVYNSMIDVVDQAEITCINKLYHEANKRFPIEKIFLDFNIESEIDWEEDKSGLLYKFINYKRN